MFALLHAAQVWAASCNITQKPKPDHRGRSSDVATDGDADAASDSGYSSDSSAYGSSPTSAQSSGILQGDRFNGNSSNRSTEQQQRQSPASKRTYRRSNEELQQGPAGNGNSSIDIGAAAVAGAESAAAAEPLLVEVDVVAHEGLTWIEVKNQVRESAHNCSVLCAMPWLLNAAACCTRCAETAHKLSPPVNCHENRVYTCCLIMYCVSKQEWFGLDSVHWMGSSHAKGLVQQVQALQAVAAAPVNSRRWRCPEVVVYFPSGVSREVAGALRDMGVVVADGPGGCMHALWCWQAVFSEAWQAGDVCFMLN
jgi:hypothetical protein